MTELLAGALLVAGVLLLVIAGVGVVRLPDALCRGHAVAKAVSLGIALILLGTAVALAAPGAGIKLALAILFQLATIPVASHLLARAAYDKNLPRWGERPTDVEGGGPPEAPPD